MTNNNPSGSNYAPLNTRNAIPTLDFDSGSIESAYFISTIPEGTSLVSGVDVRLKYVSDATSGTVVWQTEFVKLDGNDVDSLTYDTAVTGSGTVNGTAGIPTTTTITNTNLSSLAAGDAYILKVSRLGNDSADTVNSNDVQLLLAEVRSK